MKLLGSTLALAIVALVSARSTDALAQRRSDIVLTANTGHNATVRAVAFSPDGLRVLSGGEDNTAKLWDVRSGRLLRTFVGHVKEVVAVSFSPIGTLIVTGGGDALKLWDSETGELIHTFDDSRFANSAKFSADGGAVLSANGFDLKLWSVTTRSLVRIFSDRSSWVTSVDLSSDGKLALSGSTNGVARLWDVATGEVLHRFEGSAHDIQTVAFSRDGSLLLIAGNDRKLHVWNTAALSLIHTFEGHTGSIRAAVFSPDGSQILSASRGEIKLWDIPSKALTNVFKPRVNDQYEKWIWCLALAGDGSRFAVGSSEDRLELWNVATGKVEKLDGATSGAHAVLFSPDGGQVISSGFRKWDATTGRFLYEGPRGAVAGISMDWRYLLLVLDSAAEVYDLADNRRIQRWELVTQAVAGAVLSPDGATVATKSFGEPIKLRSVATGKTLASLNGYTGYVNRLTFSPDGQYLAAADNNFMVRIWRIGDARLLRTFNVQIMVEALAYSSDSSRLLIGGLGGILSVWNPLKGTSILQLAGNSWLGGDITSVAFDTSGNTAISGSSDRTVRLWDATNGKLLRTFSGHAAEVKAVAFSRDGKRMVSGAGDGSIKIWKVESGEVLVTLMANRGGEALAITPEGFFATSKREVDWVSVVRGFDLYSVDQLFQALYRPDLIRNKLSDDPEALRQIRSAREKRQLSTVLDSGPAPQLTIVSPRQGAVIEDDRVTFEAEIVAQRGGIGRLEWRVNGVTLGRQQSPNSTAERVTVSRTIMLPEGPNTVEVVAYNASDLIASRPAGVSVTLAPRTPKPKPRLYVMTISVDRYRDPIPQLDFSAKDARALAAALEASNAKAEFYAAVHVVPLFDEQVTPGNIREEFRRLSTTVQANDVFVLYMAGHGFTEDDRYYFLPYGSAGDVPQSLEQSIGQDQILDWMSEIPALRSVLIYDTCQSGSIAEDLSGFRGVPQSVAADKLSASMGRTFMAATTDIGGAREGLEGHGFFTYALLQAFARADENNNGLIEIGEVEKYVTAELPKLSLQKSSQRQTPQIRVIGADFPLLERLDIADINRLLRAPPSSP